jgi:hypothetical protein
VQQQQQQQQQVKRKQSQKHAMAFFVVLRLLHSCDKKAWPAMHEFMHSNTLGLL